MNSNTCNCDLCKGLDAKRTAALAWLGNRWILAPRRSGPATEIIIDVQLIANEIWLKQSIESAIIATIPRRPKLTLVKS